MPRPSARPCLCLVTLLALLFAGCARPPSTPAPFDAEGLDPATDTRMGRFDDGIVLTDEPATTLPAFDGVTGEPLTGRRLQALLDAADVILLGEVHNDPLAHRLQERFVRASLGDGSGALALEMLERRPGQDLRVAPGVEALEAAGLNGWANWRTFYLPIIETAARLNAPIMASNTPRPYVRMARMSGYGAMRTLPEAEQELFDFPPTGPDVDAALLPYRARFLDRMRGMRDTHARDPVAVDPATRPATRPRPTRGTRPIDFYRAQLVWDATMAQSIREARRRYGAPVVHLNGAFHSDYDGALTVLLRRAGLRVMTVSFVPTESTRLHPGDVGRADAVIYTGPLRAAPAILPPATLPATAPATLPAVEPAPVIGRRPPVLGVGPASPTTVPTTLPTTPTTPTTLPAPGPTTTPATPDIEFDK
jgi:uncharacterized iron-regulated protein